MYHFSYKSKCIYFILHVTWPDVITFLLNNQGSDENENSLKESGQSDAGRFVLLILHSRSSAKKITNAENFY